MLKYLPQIVIAVCVASYAYVYIRGILRGTVKPILATRIIFLLALVLSAVTNFKETGVQGLLANAFNLIDTTSTVIIFFLVLFNKNTRRIFTNFEKICLGAVIFVFFIWIISENNILAHLLVQIILVIAYLPTLIHLWKSDKNTESLGAWFLDLIASVAGIIEPLRIMDPLPLVYGIRSIVSVLAVIFLILRIKFRKIEVGKQIFKKIE